MKQHTDAFRLWAFLLMAVGWTLRPCLGFTLESSTFRLVELSIYSRSDRLPTILFSEPSDRDKKGKVQFSSVSAASEASPVDAVLSWIVSDSGSIVLGIVGLVLILAARLVSPESNDVTSETRANLLAVFAVGSVLLNGLSELDVQTALAETVNLEGTHVKLPCVRGEADQQLVWVLDSLVSATPSSTCVLMVAQDTGWDPMAYVGMVPPNLLSEKPTLPTASPILDRFLKLKLYDSSQRQESYLPTLQALPGRTEFTGIVLPENAQTALLLPIVFQERLAVLLLASNQARCFTPRDIAWCQAVAARLEERNFYDIDAHSIGNDKN